MQILLMWLGTITLSYTFDIIFIVNLMKEIAEAGYYIDESKLAKINENFQRILGEKSDIADKLKRFIPFMNIYNSFYLVIYKEQILSQIDALNIVKEMTEEEKRQYQEKPTFLTLLKITYKIENEKTSSCEYKDTNETDKINNDEREEKKIEQPLQETAKQKNRIDVLNEIALKIINDEIDISELENLTYKEKEYILKKAIYIGMQERKSKKKELRIRNKKYKIKKKK